MATVIKASCQDCGDVELAVDEVRVRVCADDETGAYVFRCPSCQMSVVKPAESRIVDLLVDTGVKVVRWNLPAELFERHTGAPITHDDLIDFHRIMQQDDWFSQVLALGAPR
jgi:hypothetical protein